MRKIILIAAAVTIVIVGALVAYAQDVSQHNAAPATPITLDGVNISACTKDSQCIKYPIGHCDCNNNGSREAVNKEFISFIEEYKQAQPAYGCNASFSSDPSCNDSTKAVCVQNICTIQ